MIVNGMYEGPILPPGGRNDIYMLFDLGKAMMDMEREKQKAIEEAKKTITENIPAIIANLIMGDKNEAKKI